MLHRALYYLSERLAGDLAQQASRKPKRRARVRLALPVPGISISTSLGPSGDEAGGVNRHRLADEAMTAAADEAGTLSEPGRYIFLPCAPFKLWVFSFKADRDDERPLALSLIEPDIGSALVILIGRASNVFGYHTERPIDGWIPSDPEGLRELGRFGRDADLDSAMSELLTPDPLQHRMAELLEEEPPDLIYDAAYMAKQISRTPDRRGHADVLAKVHDYRDNVTVELPALGYKQMFSRVLVGAAVFMREPEPRPL